MRIVAATDMRIGGPRHWLQRLAGSGSRAALPRLDGETLALPPRIALFVDPALNQDLYLWLAALAACFEADAQGSWSGANRTACERAQLRCPGLMPRWQRLRDAHLAQRREQAKAIRSPQAQAAEMRLQALLMSDALLAASEACAAVDAEAHQLAPVWLWLQALAQSPSANCRRWS